jgi:hypothetical protein
MSTYTTGPWYASPEIPDEEDILPPYYSIGPFEAERHYEDTICEVWTGNHDGKANAQLISAAPDLLDALTGLLDVVTLGPLEAVAKYGPDVNFNDIIESAVADARVVIEKATGQ